MIAPLRLAILASGRGSTLMALIEACAKQQIAAQIIGVFSDRVEAGALAIATHHGIPTRALSARQFDNREAFDQALFADIDAAKPDLTVSAGFMRILSARVVTRRTQRLINIHPALLPKYTGLHTHQRAIAAGDSEHGASVHFVIPRLDAGPIITQTRISIQPEENAGTLAARLLPLEHQLLINTIKLFSAHELRHNGQQVFIDGIAQSGPLHF